MATFNFALPDAGASKEVKTRVRSARFGDGYEQRVGDGINNVWETWTLNWTSRLRTEVTQIDDFLTAQAGVTWFYWTTPTGATKKFKCSTWSPVYMHDTDCSISAVFEQVFEP